MKKLIKELKGSKTLQLAIGFALLIITINPQIIGAVGLALYILLLIFCVWRRTKPVKTKPKPYHPAPEVKE